MTEYRRYQGKSYMVWSGEAAVVGYEYPMLAKNRIAGLLPFWIANADRTMQFWYDISGMQALEDWVRIKKTGHGFLKKVMAALAETMEQAGEFLLQEDGISLLPEHIFVDPEEKEIAFCYMPFEKKCFPEGLRAFMEYYLSHMDHEDREGAQKCYAVYEKCRLEHVSMEEILQILYEDKEEKHSMPDKPVQIRGTEDKVSDEGKDTPKPAFQTKKKRHLEEWLPIEKLNLFKKKKSRKIYGYEPQEFRVEPVNPTVFLGSETDQMLGELRYEGEGIGKNLPITADVYLIGSRSGEVDGMIADETVSRIHARITREEDCFYLEDMNSTNGTYRNGELLNYKERIKLEKNDRISFAKINYRFV